MGHPKKQRKKYSRPFRPYNKERIEKEKRIMKEFGLRRKKEIWRAEAMLRDFRQRARALQATHDQEKENMLVEKLVKIGLVGSGAKLEDILEVKLEHMLSRRLQTIIHKKTIANTPKQARQMITHGRIMLENRIVKWPSTIVTVDQENKIQISGAKNE